MNIQWLSLRAHNARLLLIQDLLGDPELAVLTDRPARPFAAALSQAGFRRAHTGGYIRTLGNPRDDVDGQIAEVIKSLLSTRYGKDFVWVETPWQDIFPPAARASESPSYFDEQGLRAALRDRFASTADEVPDDSTEQATGALRSPDVPVSPGVGGGGDQDRDVPRVRGGGEEEDARAPAGAGDSLERGDGPAEEGVDSAAAFELDTQLDSASPARQLDAEPVILSWRAEAPPPPPPPSFSAAPRFNLPTDDADEPDVVDSLVATEPPPAALAPAVTAEVLADPTPEIESREAQPGSPPDPVSPAPSMGNAHGDDRSIEAEGEPQVEAAEQVVAAEDSAPDPALIEEQVHLEPDRANDAESVAAIATSEVDEPSPEAALEAGSDIPGDETDEASSAQRDSENAFVALAAKRAELRVAPPRLLIAEEARSYLTRFARAEASPTELMTRLGAHNDMEINELVDPQLYSAAHLFQLTDESQLIHDNAAAAYYAAALEDNVGDDAPDADEAAERGVLSLSSRALSYEQKSFIKGHMVADYTGHMTEPFGELMWSALARLGVESGRVLLPNSGCGLLARTRPRGADVEVTQVPNHYLAGALAASLSPEDVVLAGKLHKTVLPGRYYDAAMAVYTPNRSLRSALGMPRFQSDDAVDSEPDAPLFTPGAHLLYRMGQGLKPGGVSIFVMDPYAFEEGSVRDAMLAKICQTMELSAVTSVSQALLKGADFSPILGASRDSALITVWRKLPETLAPREAEASAASATRMLENCASAPPLLSDETFLEAQATAWHQVVPAPYVPSDAGRIDPLLVEQVAKRALDHAVEGLRPQLLAALPERLSSIEDNPTARHPALSTPPPVIDPNNVDGVYRNAPGTGALQFRSEGAWQEVQVPAARAEKLSQLVGIRNLVIEALNHQMTSADDEGLAEIQQRLHAAYETFVAAFGRVSLPANRDDFSGDTFAVNVLQLEDATDDGDYVPSRFFHQRVLRTAPTVDRADSALEALSLSLGRVGCVDPLLMSAFLGGRAWAEIREELGDEIYLDPLAGAYVPKDQYLSGPIRAKLGSAIAAAKIDPDLYGENVAALRAVQPTDKTFEQITLGIGAPWIPLEDKRAFLIDTFCQGLAQDRWDQVVKLNYEAGTATHTAAFLDGEVNPEAFAEWVPLEDGLPGEGDTEAAQGDEAPGRLYSLGRFVSATLNGATIRKYRLVPDESPPQYNEDGDLIERKPRRVFDAAATSAANAFQERLKDAWVDWVSSSPRRAERLTRLYNQKINCFRRRNCTGDYLTFDNMNPAIEPLSQQRSAIARYIEDRALGVFHAMGSGKTITLAGCAVEGKRVGVHSKAVIAAPSATIPGHAAEIISAYPGARMLVGEQMSAKNPAKMADFFARASMNDWDVILVSHDAVAAMGLGTRAKLAVLKQRLSEITKDSTRKESAPSKSQATLIRQISKLEEQHTREVALGNEKLGFEAIGGDAFFIDEIHLFRNVPIQTKSNVLGINTAGGSQRAKDVDMITDWTRMQNRSNGGVVGATGTPICNSIAEVYTLSRMVNPNALRAMSIRHFDAWAATFGKIRGAVEAKPAGDGYVYRERFIEFQNVAEMTRSMLMIADMRLSDEQTDQRRQRPDLKSQLISVPITPIEQAFMKTLEVRARALADGKPLWKGESPITLMGDLSRGMVDLRLMDPTIEVDEGAGIVDAVADTVFKTWEASRDIRGTQFIFLDKGVHGAEWNCYDAIKAKLMDLGIPEREIMTAKEIRSRADRLSMNRRMNRGDLRILLGSSSRIGIGINAQERAVGGLHGDIPQRPDELMQRIARYCRPGNLNSEVTSWYIGRQGITNDYERQYAKAAAIQAALTDPDNAPDRLSESLDHTLQSVQVELTNNNVLRRKVQVDALIKELRTSRDQHRRSRQGLQSVLVERETRFATLERLAGDLPAVSETLRSEREARAQRREAAKEAIRVIADEYAALDSARNAAEDALRALERQSSEFIRTQREAAQSTLVDTAQNGLLGDLDDEPGLGESAAQAGPRELERRASRVQLFNSDGSFRRDEPTLPAELVREITAARSALANAKRAEQAGRTRFASAKESLACLNLESAVGGGSVVDSLQGAGELIYNVSRSVDGSYWLARHRAPNQQQLPGAPIGVIGDSIRLSIAATPDTVRGTRDAQRVRLLERDAAAEGNIALGLPVVPAKLATGAFAGHGFILDLEVNGLKVRRLASELPSQTASDLMALLADVEEASGDVLRLLESEPQAIDDLRVRANQPFPREAELVNLQTEKIQVDAELLEQRQSVRWEDELMMMEPMLGYRTRTGRPLHPVELELWTGTEEVTDVEEPEAPEDEVGQAEDLTLAALVAREDELANRMGDATIRINGPR